MNIVQKIAEKFEISQEQAIEVINYVDFFIGIDWSESSYRTIFKACKEAMSDMKEMNGNVDFA